MCWIRTVSGMGIAMFALWGSFSAAQGWDRPYSLCRDGRLSPGRPIDCEAELRRLRHGLPAYDPCTDGRYSYGRPRDCYAELRAWHWRDRQERSWK